MLQKHGDLCTDALIELCSEDVLTPYLHTLRAGHFAEVSAADVSHPRNHGCVKRDCCEKIIGIVVLLRLQMVIYFFVPITCKDFAYDLI